MIKITSIRSSLLVATSTLGNRIQAVQSVGSLKRCLLSKKLYHGTVAPANFHTLTLHNPKTDAQITTLHKTANAIRKENSNFCDNFVGKIR